MPFVRGAGLKASTKRLLTETEIEFCKNWVAADCDPGELGMAYKLAFKEPKSGFTWIAAGRNLLENPHVKAFVEELREPPTEVAKRKLLEQAREGDGTVATRASERIFDLDDKLGARDDATFWGEVMCEAGAEIEIPMLCAVCRERNVSTPLSGLFPQWAPKDAAPE